MAEPSTVELKIVREAGGWMAALRVDGVLSKMDATAAYPEMLDEAIGWMRELRGQEKGTDE